MGNNFDKSFISDLAPYLFPYERSLARTAPGVIDRIFSWKDAADLSDEGLRQLLQESMERLSAPLRLFSAEECAQIVFLERAGESGELARMYSAAERTFRRTYRV